MAPPTWKLLDDGHIEWSHDCPTHGKRVPAALPLGGAGWELVQADPLTIAPSIRCLGCGEHGFIRGGEWVPA